MKIKTYILIITFIITSISIDVKAQQLPQYSQYMLNNYVINPAIAGTYNYVNLKMSYRYQWLGFNPNVPQTGSVSIYGPVREKSMGWGGSAYVDVTGPISRQGVLGTYAYNFYISDQLQMSCAASVGILQYHLDFSQIEFWDQTEPLKLTSPRASVEPDANIGVYLYTTSMYFGFASHQLLGNKLKFYESADDSLANLRGVNRLKRHYYATGGYRHRFDRSLVGEAFLLLKGSSPVPIQWELSTKVTYEGRRDKQVLWGGLSYRHKDAVCVLIGGRYRKYGFGLSYDILISQMNTFTTGNLEIMLSYRFNKPQD